MSRPQLKTDQSLWPGVAAVGLFVVLAAVFLGTSLGAPTTGDSGAFVTEPKVVNVTLNDGETATLASTNESGTVLVVENGDSGDEVARVPVDDDASANATLVTVGGTASVSVQKDTGIMASIGTSMFGLNAESAGTHDRVESITMASVDSEGFLIVLEIIDLVLISALIGAIMLARREEDGDNVTVATTAESDSSAGAAVAADGGQSGGDDA